MNPFLLNSEEAINYKSDGFGQTKSPDGKEIIKVWIKIRKDSQIPEFDAITELRYFTEGFENFADLHTKLAEMTNDMGGMFIEDILKLKDRDVFSFSGEQIHPKDIQPVPLLKALKKSIVDYFKKTNQEARMLKATESVICSCRHVTNHDLEEAMQNGHNTVEALKMATGAGTGCSSCSTRLQGIIDKFKNIRTAWGKF